MGGKNSGRRPDLGRRRRAAALRAQGLSLAQVGRRLGVTKQAAAQLLRPPPAWSMCPSCGKALPADARGGRCPACVAADPGVPFPERLRAFRLAAGLTQAQLGARAQLCVASVCNYECGRGRPRPRLLAALARVLGPGLQAPPDPGRGRTP
jgi:transcriptional regulator with XRE-family HTH domain